MRTSVVAFAFDLFGSAGTAAGARLVADELREILADNRRETAVTRARAYTDHVRIQEVSFPTLEACARWRRHGRRLARGVLSRGDFLLWLSGNHLGVLPVYDELSTAAGSPLVVQLDAHLDIHQFRDSTPELSHGNFLLHCAGPLPPLINVGHRDLLLPPDQIARTFSRTFSSAQLALDPAGVLGELRERASRADQIYLDLDCDVFDPTYFPAVAEPVPFGLAPPAVLGIVEAVWSEKIRGLFVSEFDPGRDRSDQSLAALVWLIEYLLLRRHENPS